MKVSGCLLHTEQFALMIQLKTVLRGVGVALVISNEPRLFALLCLRCSRIYIKFRKKTAEMICSSPKQGRRAGILGKLHLHEIRGFF